MMEFLTSVANPDWDALRFGGLRSVIAHKYMDPEAKIKKVTFRLRLEMKMNSLYAIEINDMGIGIKDVGGVQREGGDL